MSITKADLIKMLEPFSDDISIEVARPDGASGAQIEIVGGCYVSGYGRVEVGQVAFLLEILPKDPSLLEELYEKNMEDQDVEFEKIDEQFIINCPGCKKELEVKCKHCGEEIFI